MIVWISILIGDGSEGNFDGVTGKSKIYQPCGITVDHDNIIYFTDIPVNTVKMCTPLKLTSKFLENTGKIYEAFSMHSDKQSKITMPLPQALDTVISARKYFEDSRNVLRRTLRTERALNGPDGSISNVSMNSIELLEWGLKNLNIQTSKYGFKDTVLTLLLVKSFFLRDGGISDFFRRDGGISDFFWRDDGISGFFWRDGGIEDPPSGPSYKNGA